MRTSGRSYRGPFVLTQTVFTCVRVAPKYKTHPKFPLEFLVSAHIKNIAISYPCVRCTKVLLLNFGTKKVRLAWVYTVGWLFLKLDHVRVPPINDWGGGEGAETELPEPLFFLRIDTTLMNVFQ